MELKEKGFIEMIGLVIDEVYNEKLKMILINSELVFEIGKDLKVVFIFLYGIVNKLVCNVF